MANRYTRESRKLDDNFGGQTYEIRRKYRQRRPVELDAITEICDKKKMAFFLRYFFKWKYKRIANILKSNDMNVKYYYHSTYKLCKKKYPNILIYK